MPFREFGDPIALHSAVRTMRLSPDGRVLAIATAGHLLVTSFGWSEASGAGNRSPMEQGGALLSVSSAEGVRIVENGYIMRRRRGEVRGDFVGESAPGNTLQALLAPDQQHVVVVVEDGGEPALPVVCDLRSPEGHALLPPEIDGIEGTLNALTLCGERALGVYTFLDAGGGLAGVAAVRLRAWTIEDGEVVYDRELEPAALELGDPAAFVSHGVAAIPGQLLLRGSAISDDGRVRSLGLEDVRDVAVDGERLMVATASELVELDLALEPRDRVRHGAEDPRALAASVGSIALADGNAVRRFARE